MFALYLGRATAGVKWLLLLALTLVTFILTPIIMIPALWWAKQDPVNVFPGWLQFLNTYDEPGANQGFKDNSAQVYPWFIFPTVAGQWILGKLPWWFPKASTPPTRTLQTIGWYLKTWYWLGIRNQCYTLFNWLAPVVGSVTKIETTNWRILTSGPYFCFLNKNMDVGFGWKLFNGPGKCSFYFRPRFWKKPSN